MKKILILTAIILSSLFVRAMDNATRYDLKNTYSKVEKILKLDCKVIITYLPNHYKESGVTVNGATVYYSNSNVHVIYIRRGLSIKQAIEIMIHETVHVWQMEDERIEIIDGKKYWYGFVEIHGNGTDQIHEKEAIILTQIIIDKLRKI